ncbi:MAG TPA: CoA-binding protein [Paludibacter sp.]|nr:CoA-binding protein [Paludibacter sp.]
MQPITQQQINRFVAGKTIAIVGASRKEKSFSADVAKHLQELNYKLWFVNPNYETDEPGNAKVQSITKLPKDVKHLLVLTPAMETESVVKQAIDNGMDNIWIQQTSETSAAIELAQNNNVNLIHHQCIFMFTKPTGIHKFHYTIKRVFGSLPK